VGFEALVHMMVDADMARLQEPQRPYAGVG
jgi:hypothetical protein